jgi:uncharacterized membrane protein (UPF0127 family)
VRVVDLTGPRGIRLRAVAPESRLERVRGLLGRDHLDRTEALLLPRTRSIHTVGMRIPIRVAMVDSELVVIATRVVGPTRVVLPRRSVRHIIECAAEIDVRVGDRFEASAR